MKKKLFASLAALSVLLSLTACAASPEHNPVSPSVSSVEPTTAPNSGADDDIAARNESIKPYLSNYLATGYQPDNGTFQSSISEIYLYSPKFAVADVNSDGYTDVVVWGDTGIRDHQITEVYSFDPATGSFFANTFDGYITGINNGYLLVNYEDYSVETPTYYEDSYVYELAFVGFSEVAACKKATDYDDNNNETVSTAYYSRGNEVSYEEYDRAYTASVNGTTALLDFNDMSEETILQFFPDAIGINAKG